MEFWARKEAESAQLAAEEKRAKEVVEERRQIISDIILEANVSKFSFYVY